MSDSSDEDDYRVGYGKPPKSGQFQPGKSGNPKGRRKAVKSAYEILNRELARIVPVIENGKRKKMTKMEAMVRQLANKAASGDPKSMKQVMALKLDAGEFEKPPENRIVKIRARIPLPRHLTPEQLEEWNNRPLIDAGTTIYELPPEPSKQQKKKRGER